MKIDVKESSMVKPTEATPKTCLWVSNLDAVYPHWRYVPTCYLYSSNDADSFFDSMVLKEALGHALVQFYPMAGRLKKDKNNRIEIHCNGEGALFVEAETDGVMADLGDFHDNNIIGTGFTPVVDFSQGISACSLCLVQVTRFKCGGVCLGVAISHYLADGISGVHFLNSWSDIARGRKDDIIPPFLDRKLVLSARDPPQPKYTHIEYQTPPKMNISPHNNDAAASGELILKKLRLTRDQMNALKAKCREKEAIQNTRYSTFEVLAGHVWRCATITWQLPKDQETKLRIAVDGRGRLQQPEIPQGYFGNVVFYATPIALAGELSSNTIKFAANKVHEAIAQMDNEYLRSAIDYLELQPDLDPVWSNIFDYSCPNLAVISWARLPFYDADFGWGRPTHVGYVGIPPNGICHVLPTNDGSILFGIAFPEEQMEHFEKLYYDI